MTGRIFLKLILGVLVVLAVVLTSVDVLVTQRLQAAYFDTLQHELVEKASGLSVLLSKPLPKPAMVRLADNLGTRITWIANDGKVLVDSVGDAEQMENHKARPEIAAALAGQVGHDRRVSTTLKIPYFYVAIPFQGGALRLAVPSASTDASINSLRVSVLTAIAIAFLPSVLLAAAFARYTSGRLGTIIDFTSQLAEGNFRGRLKRTGKSEFGVLSAKLNETSEKLEFMLARLETEHVELEKLERIRKDFVINVSHELRTPLASIQGYTETLLDGAINEPEHNVRFLNIIRQNTERLARLTADLLTLSRIELDQQELKFAMYLPERLLADNVDGMRPLAQKKNIELVMDYSPGCPEVFCDAEAVHQILSNLLDNAIKYTPEGGRITAGARPLPTERVEFFVRDQGSGIPAEDLTRLFERFYRVDKARSGALGGTGLGLAIVKHLTRSQGGEARVESQLNQGSTFFFTLPTRDLGLPATAPVQEQFTSL